MLLDFLTEDDQWFDSSALMLAEAADRGALFVNPIIYTEVAAGFERVEHLNAALPVDYFHVCRCHGRARFWRAMFVGPAAAGGGAVRRMPTSTWVRTRRSPG